MKYERDRQRTERERLEQEKEELDLLKRQHTLKEEARGSSKWPAEDRADHYEDRKRSSEGRTEDSFRSQEATGASFKSQSLVQVIPAA